MSFSLEVREQVNCGGKTATSRTVVTSDGIVSKEKTVPAAKAGQLTTRTSDSVGTLTMAGGHGITTGDRLDIYWSGGCRRGVLVGTVATNSVPFTLGAGDALPVNSTQITAMVPVEESFEVSGDDVLGIEMYSGALGQIVLAETDDTEVLAKSLGGADASSYRSFVWTPDRDATNPVAGDPIAKVFFSHGNSSASALMRVQALVE